MQAPAPARGSLSIRWRLTIWITIAFIVTLALIYLSFRLTVAEILYNNVDDDLATSATGLRDRMLLAPSLDEDAVRRRIADSAFPFPAIVRDADGGFIAGNSLSNAAEMALSEAQVAEITEQNRAVDTDVTLDGDAFRVRSQRGRIGDEVFIVQAGRSTQSIKDVEQALNLVLIGVAALALVVLAMGYWVARIALGPVDHITHTAAEIEASDLKRRISARGEPTEVQRLADTFDAMLARLESAFAQQRNFVMDVSHELRTPLTALRGNLDVMLMNADLDSDVRTQLERMSSEVGRLIRLTSNLLYLAHAEAGREIAQRPVELDALCLEVVHQARTLRSDVSVRLEHEEQLIVPGDRDLLKQLVLNLVDNAIKFSPAGSEVTVSLFGRGAAAEIVVVDHGPGIPAEQVARIFERFYRGSNDHSRTVGGAGIGLAISRWIAQVHGGDIRVESDAGAGSRFIVVLPLANAPEVAAVGS